MIAVDTNILVYAHRGDSPFHNAAERCVQELAEGKDDWAIPWPCIHEFLAITTHPRAYAPPSSLSESINQVEAWLEAPTLRLLAEPEQYWPELRRLLQKGRISGPMVHDARIAALCLRHGVTELWSVDRDFTRFSDLTLVNPLIR